MGTRVTEQGNEFDGVGGSFVVGKDGKRVRVEETTAHEDGNRPRDQKGEAIVEKPIAEEDLATHLAGLPTPPARKPWQAESEKPAAPAGAASQASDVTANAADTKKRG